MSQDNRFKNSAPKYTIDIEGMAGRSMHYDRLGVPGIDPLFAVLNLVSKTSRPGFRRDSWCHGCSAWGKGDKLERLARPVAPDPAVSCNGCHLGYLDPVPGVALDELRDKLMERWIKARDALRRINLEARECFEPRDKERNRRERVEAEAKLKVAAEDCKAAGFSPGKRSKRTQVLAEVPTPRAALASPIGPHWTGSNEE